MKRPIRPKIIAKHKGYTSPEILYILNLEEYIGFLEYRSENLHLDDDFIEAYIKQGKPDIVYT